LKHHEFRHSLNCARPYESSRQKLTRREVQIAAHD
jgi:hypothetical protein